MPPEVCVSSPSQQHQVDDAETGDICVWCGEELKWVNGRWVERNGVCSSCGDPWDWDGDTEGSRVCPPCSIRE